MPVSIICALPYGQVRGTGGRAPHDMTTDRDNIMNIERETAVLRLASSSNAVAARHALIFEREVLE